MKTISKRDDTRRESRLRWIAAVVSACAIAASGCASLDVQSDWDPEVDFGRLQTWRWADQSQTPTGNASLDTNGLLAKRVMRSVEKVMVQRGYKKTGTSEGDFEVAWFFTVEPKTKVTTINDYHGYGGGRGWYGGGYGGGSSTTMVDSYNQGTLVIDVRDATSGKLIWRGAASARLKEKSDPDKAQERADNAVTQILAKFPPPSAPKS